MKVLYYVDGENISESQLTEKLKEVIDYRKSYEVRGKIYGDRSNMGKVLDICLGFGFDFIETANLSLVRKSLADMKLIVDAMSDVLDTHKGDVYKVILVSNDVDFKPLVYKLTGYGVLVESFLHLDGDTNFVISTKDIGSYLHTTGFLPASDKQCLTVPYVSMRHAIPTNIADGLILDYVAEHYNRFLEILSDMGMGAAALLDLEKIKVREVSIQEVLFVLKKHGCTKSFSQVVLVWSQQLFGKAPKQSFINSYLKEL